MEAPTNDTDVGLTLSGHKSEIQNGNEGELYWNRNS